MTDKLNKYY